MNRIGLLSEDGALYSLLVSALGRDYDVTSAPSEDEIMSLVDEASCDLIIVDLCSDVATIEDRIDCARRLIDLPLPVLIMADDAMLATAEELVQAGAAGSCRRRPSARELRTAIAMGSGNAPPEKHIVPAAQSQPSNEPDNLLIGSSPQIRQVYHLIHRVANLNASILVTGESGTGKELIARAIHKLGSRANKPFVAVSCGAIPETLIEAELFGHEKGAFTGTVGSRAGYFELVGDGTLFLDEIGDLSLYTQVKLLRVLQQLEFSRLGSSRLIPLRARLIFATHQDLGKLVEEGKFRQDLYYRINVMRIVSPALADHPEDIPEIAMHYLRHYSLLFQKPMDAITPEAMAMFQSYNWPGNVRELENTIQRAIIMAPGAVVRPEDLPLCMHADKVVEFSDYNPDSSFERQIRDYKVRLAVEAVRDNNGNKTLAARSLGISRAYLHRLIRMAEPGSVLEQDGTNSASASA